MMTPNPTTPQPVPREIAVCPECQSSLTWQIGRTRIQDRQPHIYIDCSREDDACGRRDWQPVIDRVKAWIAKQP